MQDHHATIMQLRRYKEDSPRRQRNIFFLGLFIGLLPLIAVMVTRMFA